MKTTLTLLFSLFIVVQAEAQFWKKVKDAVKRGVENTVERRTEKETDKATDKTLDEIFKKDDKSDKNSKNKTYTFNQSVEMEYISPSKDKLTYIFLFNRENKDIVCIDISKVMTSETENVGSMYMVLSPNGAVMFMDMAGMKIKRSVNNKQLQNADMSKHIPDDLSIEATGKTKTIAGFTCYEYISKSKEHTSTVWITEKLPIMGNHTAMLGKVKNKNVSGFIVEATIKTDQGTSTLQLKKYNPNASFKIKSSDYNNIGF